MDKEEAPKVTVLPPRAAHGVRRPLVGKRGRVRIDVEQAVRQTGPAARPWEATGSIGVEALVVWAFRDQKAHRHAGVGLHRIEASVSGLEPSGRSSDGCAAIADIEHMGCRIDRSSVTVRDTVHPAAEAVAGELLDIEDGDLVRFFGTLGGRPDGWAEPVRWYRPVVWVTYGVEGQWERNDSGGSRARLTRVIPTVTLAELARRRGEYERWWEALDALAWRLSMRALGFAVLRPDAPRAPWLDAGVERAR